MQFLTRALSGFVIAGITLALLAAGAWRLQTALSESSGKRKPPARERSYAVEVETFKSISITPTITAYGAVEAWRTLEIRAAVSGPIVELKPNFRDGATVEKGELLFRVDPQDAQRRVADAEVALLLADAELAEAKAVLGLVEAEVKTAKEQLAIKKNDLNRKQALLDNGHVTQVAIDEAAHAASVANQALATKKQSGLSARMRIKAAEHGVARSKIALADTRRALSDTSYRAPFAGRLTEVEATLGRRVSQNEKLGVVIDPEALEVSFRVRDAEFGRLLAKDASGKLSPLPLKATLDLGGRKIEVDGTIDRAAAVTSTADGGRTVYAKISSATQSAIRPGDFVTVYVREPALNAVALIPARATSENGRLFIIGSDGRLAEIKAKILRRQGANLIVAGVPFGKSYVKTRLPYLSVGVAVTPRSKDAPAKTGPAIASKSRGSSDMISLSAKRRTALIAAVKANARMPQARKERILAMLEKPQAPRRLIERLESRLKGGRS